MKISERGQITIPKRLRERFGFRPDVEVEITPAEGGLLIRKQTNSEHPVDQVHGIIARRMTTDEYIEEIRGR
jgi:AbrB family looped-hinge helix DNA binding protein